MRRLLVITSLAALLVGAGTTVFAANERHVDAEFSPLAAAGISGRVALTEAAVGRTNLVLQLKGLEPGAEYVSEWYTVGSCAEGTPQTLGTFQANPAGIAVFNAQLQEDLSQIRSISVKIGSDMSLQACATIPQ